MHMLDLEHDDEIHKWKLKNNPKNTIIIKPKKYWKTLKHSMRSSISISRKSLLKEKEIDKIVIDEEVKVKNIK